MGCLGGRSAVPDTPMVSWRAFGFLACLWFLGVPLVSWRAFGFLEDVWLLISLWFSTRRWRGDGDVGSSWAYSAPCAPNQYGLLVHPIRGSLRIRPTGAPYAGRPESRPHPHHRTSGCIRGIRKPAGTALVLGLFASGMPRSKKLMRSSYASRQPGRSDIGAGIIGGHSTLVGQARYRQRSQYYRRSGQLSSAAAIHS